MASSFLKNPMYIHIICETVIIGSIFVVLNRRTSKLQTELNDCIVRLGKQTARIAELEETVQSMAESINMIHSMTLRSALTASAQAPSQAPAPAPAPKPKARKEDAPAPVSAPATVQPVVAEETYEMPQPFRGKGGDRDTQNESSVNGTSDLDTQIQSELQELQSI